MYIAQFKKSGVSGTYKYTDQISKNLTSTVNGLTGSYTFKDCEAGSYSYVIGANKYGIGNYYSGLVMTVTKVIFKDVD